MISSCWNVDKRSPITYRESVRVKEKYFIFPRELVHINKKFKCRFKKCPGIEFLPLLTANSLECILYYKLNLQSNLNSPRNRISAGSVRPSQKGYAENSNQFQMPHAFLAVYLAFDSLVRRNGYVCMKMVSQMSRFSNNATCCDFWKGLVPFSIMILLHC